MTLTTITIIAIIFYLVLIKAVAIFAHQRSTRTVSDFFIASRTISTPLLVGTVIATMINTLAVTGVPALVYKGGILYSQMFVIGITVPLLIYLFGTKIWRYGKQHGVMTQGEMFGDYYQSRSILIISALLGLLSIFPFMTIQLSAIGKVVSVTTSGAISYDMAVLVSAISIGLYLYFGGSRAVVWTDMVQSVFFLLLIIVSAILFTYWSDGYASGVTRLYTTIPEKLSFTEKNLPIFIDNILSWPFAFFLWPQLFQRMFMAKSAEIVECSVKWNFILFNLVVLSTMTMGIMATGMLYGKIDDPDQLVAMMYSEFLPIGGAFIVVAVIATGMSTIDSILLTSASIVQRDLMQGSSKHSSNFQLARYIALLFLLCTTLFALTDIGRGAMVPLVTLGASIATLFLWPLIGVFYWKRVTAPAVSTAMIFGFVAICLFEFSPIGGAFPFGSATAGFFVALLQFVGVTLSTPSAHSNFLFSDPETGIILKRF